MENTVDKAVHPAREQHFAGMTGNAPNEEIFRLLVEAVQDYAIFVLSTEGKILTWNLGASRLKGYSAEEVIGTHFSRFYTQADIERNHPAHELELAKEFGKYEEEGWRVKKDGSMFWANVVITALRDKAGVLKGFAKVTRDLTERKKAEDRLKAAYQNLEKRVELRTRELNEAKEKAELAVKAREQFFSIASHELKTPIAALKLQAQLRKRDVARGNFSEFTPEKLPDLCKDDERQVGRLAFLVENMMDISRLTTGTFRLSLEEADLKDLLLDVAKRIEPILKDSGNSLKVVADDPVSLPIDVHRIEQVITNLLTNAGRYAPGTTVEIELTSDVKFASIEVRDKGKGISKEHQQKIFAPFERLQNFDHIKGLGLGLYISKQIVEAHGGEIRVESNLGEGATFRVCLPLSSNEEGQE